MGDLDPWARIKTKEGRSMRRIKLASLGTVLLVTLAAVAAMAISSVHPSRANATTNGNSTMTLSQSTQASTVALNVPPIPADIQVPKGNVLAAQIVGVGDLT